MVARRAGLVVLLALALAVGACARASGGGEAPSAPVRQLASIGALQEAFNADAGATRLVLLISPT